MDDTTRWIMIALLLLLIGAAVFMLLRSPGKESRADELDRGDTGRLDTDRDGRTADEARAGHVERDVYDQESEARAADRVEDTRELPADGATGTDDVAYTGGATSTDALEDGARTEGGDGSERDWAAEAARIGAMGAAGSAAGAAGATAAAARADEVDDRDAAAAEIADDRGIDQEPVYTDDEVFVAPEQGQEPLGDEDVVDDRAMDDRAMDDRVDERMTDEPVAEEPYAPSAYESDGQAPAPADAGYHAEPASEGYEAAPASTGYDAAPADQPAAADYDLPADREAPGDDDRDFYRQAAAIGATSAAGAGAVAASRHDDAGTYDAPEAHDAPQAVQPLSTEAIDEGASAEPLPMEHSTDEQLSRDEAVAQETAQEPTPGDRDHHRTDEHGDGPLTADEVLAAEGSHEGAVERPVGGETTYRADGGEAVAVDRDEDAGMVHPAAREVGEEDPGAGLDTAADTQAGADEFSEAGYGPGSVLPLEDGRGPEGWTVKGNAGSMLFHTPESPSYDGVRAEVWFESEEAAREAGFAHWDRRRR